MMLLIIVIVFSRSLYYDAVENSNRIIIKINRFRIKCMTVHFFRTLPVPDSPYPMLVLVGPQGMGKRNLALKLVEELPDYFGYAYVRSIYF